jgi:hypothetical protein
MSQKVSYTCVCLLLYYSQSSHLAGVCAHSWFCKHFCFGLGFTRLLRPYDAAPDFCCAGDSTCL